MVELADRPPASQVQLVKIPESSFRPREWVNRPEQLLLNRWQQESHPRGDDPKRLTSARQAAEALFTPKRQITEQSVSDSPPPDQSARKPRVLAASSAVPVRLEEVDAPVSPKARTMTEIPLSQFARIRAWVKYGMTVPQIAEVYGVGVGAIERILRKG
jgi:hypothetical protein